MLFVQISSSKFESFFENGGVNFIKKTHELRKMLDMFHEACSERIKYYQ